MRATLRVLFVNDIKNAEYFIHNYIYTYSFYSLFIQFSVSKFHSGNADYIC
jgi:hypothetical protein